MEFAVRIRVDTCQEGATATRMILRLVLHRINRSSRNAHLEGLKRAAEEAQEKRFARKNAFFFLLRNNSAPAVKDTEPEKGPKKPTLPINANLPKNEGVAS